MRIGIAAATIAAALVYSGRAAALEACINGPSSYGGTIDAAATDAVIALGPRCVRVGYRQDTAPSYDDPAQLAKFDALIAKYEAAGIETYMLIHTESFNIDAHSPNDAVGRAMYVDGAIKLVDHFKAHVRRFELINEPNNWDSTQHPTVTADGFAATLADVYSGVKVQHPNDACWNVDLVSGALFAFHRANGEGGSASDYLDQTYAAGIASHGWDTIRQTTGSYPLDGIGWHIYMESTDAATTASELGTYLDQVWGVVTQHEPGSMKKIWISELGFGTDSSAAQDAAQALGLDNVFDALGAQPHVGMAMWFTFQDFDGAGWGLYRGGGFDAAHARPSRARFVAQTQSKAEALWAKLAFTSVPTAVAPGARATLAVTATNLGTETWKETDGVRLGAGPGCPITPSTNAVRWAPAKGYANSAVDARVYLGSADAIGHGGAKTFALDVVAPITPGTYTVSARMVRDGMAWFGTAAQASLVVAALDTDGGVAGGDAGGGTVGGDGGRAGGGADAGAPINGDVVSAGGCNVVARGDGASDATPFATLAALSAVTAGSRRRRLARWLARRQPRV